MNQDLAEELEYMKDLLAKSGFFDSEEIIEILEDQFIEEDIDFSECEISLNDFSNENFSKLESVFTQLANEKIVAIHNCGYDISEGVNDAFELYLHLQPQLKLVFHHKVLLLNSNIFPQLRIYLLFVHSSLCQNHYGLL